MATADTRDKKDVPEQKIDPKVDDGDRDVDSIDLQKEVWDATAVDPVLARKMALINDAMDEVGMTPWQWKVRVHIADLSGTTMPKARIFWSWPVSGITFWLSQCIPQRMDSKTSVLLETRHSRNLDGLPSTWKDNPSRTAVSLRCSH